MQRITTSLIAIDPETAGREVRRTDSGRAVYGGGGITPDHVIHADRESGFLSRLRRENIMFDFAVRYVAAHPNLKSGFAVGDDGIKEFQAFLASRKFTYDAEAFESSRKGIDLRLRSQIGRVKWGAETESKILVEGDVQVQKAMTLFDEAAKLAAAGKLARRSSDEKGAQSTELKAAVPAS